MQYMGGKHRQAKRIVEHFPSGGVYVEPFLGAASVAVLAAPLYETSLLSDANADLIELWRRAVVGDWVAPDEHISEERYAVLRAGGGSAADRAFAATALSFAGRWFEGFARNRVGTDYYGAGLRSVGRKAAALSGARCVTISRADYAELSGIGSGCVVYCDPPYAGTKGYSRVKGFDSGRFWEVATGWAEAGASVFVSEYSAPDGWVAVDTWERTNSVRLGSTITDVESLYVYEGGV